jgi:hypothetical protein
MRNHALHQEVVIPLAEGAYTNITQLKELLTYAHM